MIWAKKLPMQLEIYKSGPQNDNSWIEAASVDGARMVVNKTENPVSASRRREHWQNWQAIVFFTIHLDFEVYSLFSHWQIVSYNSDIS